MTERWFTVQVHQALVATASYHLRRQGFEPFFPQVLIAPRVRGDPEKLQPLFKGYGFVKFDPQEQPHWPSINGTRGVIKLLPRWLDYPDPMPIGVVEKLLDHNPVREADILGILEAVFDKEFFPGMTVQVRTGLLAGREGKITDMRSKLLEISFLRQGRGLHAIWISRDAVDPVGDNSSAVR